MQTGLKYKVSVDGVIVHSEETAQEAMDWGSHHHPEGFTVQ